MTPDVSDQGADGLIVTVRSPELAEPIDLRLPGGVPVGRLLPRLIEALRLTAGPYQLLRHGTPIPEDQSLFAARVLAGDTLSLQPVVEKIPDESIDQVDRARDAGAVRLADLLPSQIDRRPARRGRTVAFWSGPAGGTGRTTLALALAVRAAEHSEAVGLLALSEPAVSATLGLPRVPNVDAFFERNVLQTAEQTVQWAGDEGPAELRIVLGPTRPEEGTSDPNRVDALVTAAQRGYDRVFIDLPPLVPGGSPWATTPLTHADAVVVVTNPSAAGVAATVAALSVMEKAGITVTIHLAGVRRAPGGLPVREMRAGITSLWGTCPPLVEVPFWEDLPSKLDRGELPGRSSSLVGGLPRDGQRWIKAIETLERYLAPTATQTSGI